VKVDSSVQSVGGLLGGSAKPAKAAPRAAASSGDQVELSPLSARLQEISAEMASAPAMDAGRVAEIKQAITEGHFQINPERIADGLIESVRQMLVPGR
jgi:negative regulator of flagellin synthesis FlgM